MTDVVALRLLSVDRVGDQAAPGRHAPRMFTITASP
jgi:hypothetical protein